MKGRYVLEVRRKGITFRLVLERQVTVITGGSGTGKTSFINTCRMLVDGSNSKVKSIYKDRYFGRQEEQIGGTEHVLFL